MRDGDADNGNIMSGQIAGLVHKEQPAAEMIEEMFKERKRSMKIGIVFAGQGAQYSGMGKDLYDAYPEAKEIFDMQATRSRSGASTAMKRRSSRLT